MAAIVPHAYAASERNHALNSCFRLILLSPESSRLNSRIEMVNSTRASGRRVRSPVRSSTVLRCTLKPAPRYVGRRPQSFAEHLTSSNSELHIDVDTQPNLGRGKSNRC